MITRQYMCQLMGTRETRQYLHQRHSISRSQTCVGDWLREGRILPVLSYGRPGYMVRLTTREQVDLAVRDERVPPGPERRRTRKALRNEVAVQLMDELGLTLAGGDAARQRGGEEE
ncbi:MAG TPA: hypothetical protein VM537_12170 [Anaerolineae bacterium]|nr:hypothetical protein [Anaerolineae bacterium]